MEYGKDMEGLSFEEALDVVLAGFSTDKRVVIKRILMEKAAEMAAPFIQEMGDKIQWLVDEVAPECEDGIFTFPDGDQWNQKPRARVRRIEVHQTGSADPAAIALETEYAGVRFRSRIEARWAVVMDELGIVWEYEKEGLELKRDEMGDESVWYLPDFWLPQLGVWLEVKGAEPTREEVDKAALLNLCSGSKVYLTHGDVPRDVDSYMTEQAPGMLLFDHGCDLDDRYFFAKCRRCLKVGLSVGGRTDLLCDCSDSHYGTLDERRMLHAYSTARAERFGT